MHAHILADDGEEQSVLLSSAGFQYVVFSKGRTEDGKFFPSLVEEIPLTAFIAPQQYGEKSEQKRSC